MSENHKPEKRNSRNFGNEGDRPKYCKQCRIDMRFRNRDLCPVCMPEIARSRIFQVRLPLHTLNLIKAKHKNVSAYLRGLIAKDLGPESLPKEALNRPGGGKLRVLTDI